MVSYCERNSIGTGQRTIEAKARTTHEKQYNERFKFRNEHKKYTY